MDALPVELLSGHDDDALILAASWEERCLGLARRLDDYSCRRIIVTEYDGRSRLRDRHLSELRATLAPRGSLSVVAAAHADPLKNVRETIDLLRTCGSSSEKRISIDLTTFTRKHLLQLLQGLDLAGYLGSCRFFHTEPVDYDTRDDEPISEGISHVRAIDSFAGVNTPSRDSLLVLFLGYEGRRAQALWEHLDPNVTLCVLAEPSYRPEWNGRAEAQNHYLLSCIPKERVFRVPARNPQATSQFLTALTESDEYGLQRYNYRIAPVGSKPQVLGMYRFWRCRRGDVTIMYAAPARYREEHATFKPGATWLIDSSTEWRCP